MLSFEAVGLTKPALIKLGESGNRNISSQLVNNIGFESETVTRRLKLTC